MTLTDRTCAFPPHPENADDQTPAVVAPESALSRFCGWLRHAPAERVPLPAIPAVWTAAEIMHATGVSGLYPGAAAAVAALGAGWFGERRASDPDHARLAGAEVAAVTGTAGSWLTAATAWGPLAGPDHLMTLAYLAGAGGGYWWLRRHDAVRAARARRDEAAAWTGRKTAWHRLAPRLGLQGSHLLEYEDTLLGDTMLIDTRGTGRRASQVSARDVAERLGEIEAIPVGRIDVATDPIPGRLRITVRRKDPWSKPLLHPVTHPDSPYAKYVEDPATCRKPLVIGGDPETGRPLQLTLWDEDEGGKVIMVIAKKGSGKTVLLSCISERVTACPDARLLQVNLGKHREDLRWKPLAAASALGRDDLGRARRLLQYVVNEIEERSKTGAASKVEPTPDTPLLVVKIDEVDQVARDPICKQLLSDIASKCRSEAVCLIIAGQRATAQWLGGADLRANADIAVLGRFSRASEARKATDDIELPDMGAYGEGHPGVWLVYELGGGGGYGRGRVFKLEDPAEIETIVARRAGTCRPYRPRQALAALWDKITSSDFLSDDEDDYGYSADAGAAIAPGVLPDTGKVTAKARAALDTLAGTDDTLAGLPDLSPAMAAHYAEMLAERQRQALQQNYGDVEIPARVRAVLLPLLAAPAGTSASEAGAAIGKSKTVAFGYLSALRAAGIARLDGSGRGARFRLASSPAPAGRTAPGLSVVPEDDDEDDDDNTAAGDAP
jgi:hypothetical protein